MLLKKFYLTSSITAASLALSTGLQAQQVVVDTGQSKVQVQGQKDGAAVNVDVKGQDETRNGKMSSKQAMNHQIAKWLEVDQNSMVELAKYGLTKSKTPAVRQLAEKIVADHQAFADKLAAVDRSMTMKGQQDSKGDTQESADDDNKNRNEDSVRGNRNREDRPIERLANRVENGVDRLAERTENAVDYARETVRDQLASDRTGDGRYANQLAWVSIHKEITNKLNAAAREDLEPREGYEFDAALVGMFVASHLDELATLQVMQEHASGDLQTTIKDALPTIKSHKQAAEKVMRQISR